MKKHPLDGFLEHLENAAEDDNCSLCEGSGEIMYKGMWTNFMDVCSLCNGSGKAGARNDN